MLQLIVRSTVCKHSTATAVLMRDLSMQNVHVTAYSPLGTPPSSAMFKDYQPDLIMNDPVVKDLAKKYNKNVGQVSLLLTNGFPHAEWL